MSDEDLIGRVRAAVHSEMGAPDDALADRLLRGTARRRRARRTGTLVIATVLLAGAALGGASLRSGAGQSTLRIEGAAPELGRLTPSEAGAVTGEQAARKGADGSAECNAYAASNPGPVGGDVTSRLSLYAAYLTDNDGFEQWTTDYTGSFKVYKTPQPVRRELIALCWFSGDVAPDLSAGPATVPLTHQLIAIQVDPPTVGFRYDQRSAGPIPVLAPPLPTNPTSAAPLRSFPQPPGVPSLDELPARRPPEPVKPVDCSANACVGPDMAQVQVKILLDGTTLDPFGFRELTPGKTVKLQFTVEVEKGQTISDVTLALSGPNGTYGVGGTGLFGVDKVFASAPTVTGTRTFDATYTVPKLTQVRQFLLDYHSNKSPQLYPDGLGSSGTIGGITVPGAEPSH